MDASGARPHSSTHAGESDCSNQLQAPLMTYYYNIDAQAKGVTLSEWNLSPGDRVVVEYSSGMWSCNPAVTPAYYDGSGNPNYVAKPGYLYQGVVEGCLIACVGNPTQAMYAVGNYGIVGDDTNSGPLWVACNDDWDGIYGAGYPDNQGTITIAVSSLAGAMRALRNDEEIVQFVEAFKTQITASVVAKLGSTIQDVYAARNPRAKAPARRTLRPAKSLKGRRR